MRRVAKRLDSLFESSPGNVRLVLGQPAAPGAITLLFEQALPQIYGVSEQQDRLHNGVKMVEDQDRSLRLNGFHGPHQQARKILVLAELR